MKITGLQASLPHREGEGCGVTLPSATFHRNYRSHCCLQGKLRQTTGPDGPRTPVQDAPTGNQQRRAAGKVKGMRIATAFRSLILAAAISTIPAASFAGVFVSIGIGAPPVLPVYVQPVCPAAGYIWTPGYWAYDDYSGYYWVPGAWVLAPYEGALWTPGYWGWGDGGYLWHTGYWGRHVGFYGGVNYGFGYFGRGYEGGRWDHDRFEYNRSVTNVNIVNVHNVYNERVVNNYNTTRVSFNGGRGGVQMRPTSQEQNWGREQHTAILPAQRQNEMRASQNREQFANVNHGRPVNLARTEPVAFNRNVPLNNRPISNRTINNRPVNNGLTTASPTHTAPVTNANRPAPFNNGQRQAYNQNPLQGGNNTHPQTPAYRAPNMQMNQHTQPQPMRPAPAQPQSYHPQPQQMNQHTQPQAYRPQSQPQQMYRPQPQQMNQRTQPQAYRPQPQQQYRPQPQMNQHAQPQMRAPQQFHPEPSRGNGGGHEGGGHGGHGR